MAEYILVVIADAAMRDAIYSIVKEAGYPVSQLGRLEDVGEETTIVSALQQYALLLMDVENIRSAHLVDFLRHKQRNVRPYILVIFRDHEYKGAINDNVVYNAVNHFISIPFHAEEIRGNLERYMGKRGPRS